VLLGYNADFDVPRFPNRRDAEICQVIDKLTAAWELFAERNFDIGEGIPESNQAIPQKVDAQKIGVRENFCAARSL
jgi:hypothetical protein